ncbi:MAG TPA: butyrate kinase, partial [Acidobacteriota bacterium]|nr:butyrate kinase [Acidobacteriota bacterium]
MAETSQRILAINPGSTSTKIAVFEGRTLRCGQTLRHDEHVIGQYATITDQYAFRLQAILDFLAVEAIPLDSLQAIVGRGGLLRPIEGGTYSVSDAMLKDLRESQMGQHASNLG